MNATDSNPRRSTCTGTCQPHPDNIPIGKLSTENPARPGAADPKLRRLLPILLALLGLGGSLNTAHAATPVSGSVREARWTKANSPYHVNGDLVVAGLEIQPGVQVRFQGDYVLEVAGVLRAVGTRDDPIVFSRNDNGGWQGIFFNHSPQGSELRWCIVSKAVNSGIRIADSPPVLDHCTIRENTSPGNGGGVWANLEGLPESTLQIHDCVVASNVANIAKAPGTYGGGGIALWGNARLTRCTIESNQCFARCEHYTQPVVAAGGGLYAQGDVTAIACRIRGNRTEAIGACDDSWQIVKQLIPVGGGIAHGAGVLLLANSIVTGNTLVATPSSSLTPITPRGSGLFVFGGAASVLNSTFVYNGAGGTVWAGGGNITVTNSILFQNSDTPLGAEPGVQVSATYSDVEGGYDGNGNRNVNPDLLEPGLRISAESGCVDAGDPGASFADTCFPPSCGTSRNDLGAHGGPFACEWGQPPAITQQPQSVSGPLGSTAVLTVSASGTDPLRYQWHFNGAALIGQTGSRLTLPSLTAPQAGLYTVTVSNEFGSITSEPARLSIQALTLKVEMYAGLTVSGKVGDTVVICYAIDPAQQASWTSLATNTLTEAEWFYVDRQSPFDTKRFYRATTVGP